MSSPLGVGASGRRDVRRPIMTTARRGGLSTGDAFTPTVFAARWVVGLVRRSTESHAIKHGKRNHGSAKRLSGFPLVRAPRAAMSETGPLPRK